jgi:hypothetical protein
MAASGGSGFDGFSGISRVGELIDITRLWGSGKARFEGRQAVLFLKKKNQKNFCPLGRGLDFCPVLPKDVLFFF